MSVEASAQRRGGPLAVIAVLLFVWVAGRAAFWEDPFAIREIGFAEAERTIPNAQNSFDNPAVATSVMPQAIPGAPPSLPWQAAVLPGLSVPAALVPESSEAGWSRRMSPTIAAGHQFLMAAAFSVDWPVEETVVSRAAPGTLGASVNPAFPPTPSSQQSLDRWSLDAFAFFREGSTRQDPSQGRVPVYGANQIGANVQFRIAPDSANDPRAYLRAYRALVSGGETEVAAGVSARPVGAVPVRLAAEVRVTESGFRTEVRPAASLTSELPPVGLPANFTLEAFGGAGYVGGGADTFFADGQATVTREVAAFEGVAGEPVRFSLGAGTWGGAQKDAHRLDVGPTMRIDLSVGDVPARISVDWREQVVGEAVPSSGVAATLSTRF